MQANHTLERTLATIVGREYALATGSGTVALVCAIRALGIPPESRVAVPSIVCPSVVMAVLAAGARPVFCDVSPRDLNLDPESLRNVMNARTNVIIAVDTFGVTCDLKRVSDIASHNGGVVIEDFAQGFGNASGGHPLGSSGLVSITSFEREKLFDAGGGGALFTDDASLYREAMRVLRSLPERGDSWPNRVWRRLSLAWIDQSCCSPALRRHVLAAVARQLGPPLLSASAAERILELVGKRREYTEARRSRLAEVIDRNRNMPRLKCLADPEAVLTMATFVLPFRPALRARWLARARGLFFLYRPLHGLYRESSELTTSANLDGRLANISLAPARDGTYLGRAVSALKACVGAASV